MLIRFGSNPASAIWRVPTARRTGELLALISPLPSGKTKNKMREMCDCGRDEIEIEGTEGAMCSMCFNEKYGKKTNDKRVEL